MTTEVSGSSTSIRVGNEAQILSTECHDIPTKNRREAIEIKKSLKLSIPKMGLNCRMRVRFKNRKLSVPKVRVDTVLYAAIEFK